MKRRNRRTLGGARSKDVVLAGGQVDLGFALPEYNPDMDFRLLEGGFEIDLGDAVIDRH